MDKFLGRLLLDGTVFIGAGTGVDGKREVERHLRLALEDRDLLRAVVFSDLEVILGEAADDGAGLIGDVDEDTHQLHVEAQRLVVLRDEAEGETEYEQQADAKDRGDLAFSRRAIVALHGVFRRKGLAIGPDRAVNKGFLLPDWHGFLERVDEPAAGFVGLARDGRKRQ